MPYTWVVDRFETKVENGITILKLRSGNQTSPIITISYERIEIMEMDISIIDRITPNWFKPFSPFARRSLEEIFQFIQSKKIK